MLHLVFPVAPIVNKHAKKKEIKNQLFRTFVTVYWTYMSVGYNENNILTMNSNGHGQPRQLACDEIAVLHEEILATTCSILIVFIIT